MNSVDIIGRLTRDCEKRSMSDGAAVVSFDLAVDTGTKAVPSTMFLSMTAFGKTGEIVSQYAGTKGTQIAVSGRLRQENWTDKDSGKNRSKISCVAERVTLLGGGKSRDDQTPSSYSGESSQDVPEQSSEFDPRTAVVPF